MQEKLTDKNEPLHTLLENIVGCANTIYASTKEGANYIVVAPEIAEQLVQIMKDNEKECPDDLDPNIEQY